MLGEGTTRCDEFDSRASCGQSRAINTVRRKD